MYTTTTTNPLMAATSAAATPSLRRMTSSSVASSTATTWSQSSLEVTSTTDSGSRVMPTTTTTTTALSRLQTRRRPRNPRRFVVTELPDDASFFHSDDDDEDDNDHHNSTTENARPTAHRRSSVTNMNTATTTTMTPTKPRVLRHPRPEKMEVRGRFTIIDLSPDSPEMTPSPDPRSVMRTRAPPRRLTAAAAAASATTTAPTAGLHHPHHHHHRHHRHHHHHHLSPRDSQLWMDWHAVDRHLEFLQQESSDMKHVLESMIASNARWIDTVSTPHSNGARDPKAVHPTTSTTPTTMITMMHDEIKPTTSLEDQLAITQRALAELEEKYETLHDHSTQLERNTILLESRLEQEMRLNDELRTQVVELTHYTQLILAAEPYEDENATQTKVSSTRTPEIGDGEGTRTPGRRSSLSHAPLDSSASRSSPGTSPSLVPAVHGSMLTRCTSDTSSDGTWYHARPFSGTRALSNQSLGCSEIAEDDADADCSSSMYSPRGDDRWSSVYERDSFVSDWSNTGPEEGDFKLETTKRDDEPASNQDEQGEEYYEQIHRSHSLRSPSSYSASGSSRGSMSPPPSYAARQIERQIDRERVRRRISISPKSSTPEKSPKLDASSVPTRHLSQHDLLHRHLQHHR